MQDLHREFDYVYGHFAVKAQAETVAGAIRKEITARTGKEFGDKSVVVEGKRGYYSIFFPRLSAYWHPVRRVEIDEELDRVCSNFKEFV